MSFYHVQIVKCTSCKADRSRASHSAEEQSMTLYLCWFGCSFLRDTFSPRVICHIYSRLHGSTMHKWHLSREWSTCQLTRGPKFKALYLQKTIRLSSKKCVPDHTSYPQYPKTKTRCGNAHLHWTRTWASTPLWVQGQPGLCSEDLSQKEGGRETVNRRTGHDCTCL